MDMNNNNENNPLSLFLCIFSVAHIEEDVIPLIQCANKKSAISPYTPSGQVTNDPSHISYRLYIFPEMGYKLQWVKRSLKAMESSVSITDIQVRDEYHHIIPTVNLVENVDFRLRINKKMSYFELFFHPKSDRLNRFSGMSSTVDWNNYVFYLQIEISFCNARHSLKKVSVSIPFKCIDIDDPFRASQVNSKGQLRMQRSSHALISKEWQSRYNYEISPVFGMWAFPALMLAEVEEDIPVSFRDSFKDTTSENRSSISRVASPKQSVANEIKSNDSKRKIVKSPGITRTSPNNAVIKNKDGASSQSSTSEKVNPNFKFNHNSSKSSSIVSSSESHKTQKDYISTNAYANNQPISNMEPTSNSKMPSPIAKRRIKPSSMEQEANVRNVREVFTSLSEDEDRRNITPIPTQYTPLFSLELNSKPIKNSRSTINEVASGKLQQSTLKESNIIRKNLQSQFQTSHQGNTKEEKEQEFINPSKKGNVQQESSSNNTNQTIRNKGQTVSSRPKSAGPSRRPKRTHVDEFIDIMDQIKDHRQNEKHRYKALLEEPTNIHEKLTNVDLPRNVSNHEEGSRESHEKVLDISKSITSRSTMNDARNYAFNISVDELEDHDTSNYSFSKSTSTQMKDSIELSRTKSIKKFNSSPSKIISDSGFDHMYANFGIGLRFLEGSVPLCVEYEESYALVKLGTMQSFNIKVEGPINFSIYRIIGQGPQPTNVIYTSNWPSSRFILEVALDLSSGFLLKNCNHLESGLSNGYAWIRFERVM